jgi:hypothetical protein
VDFNFEKFECLLLRIKKTQQQNHPPLNKHDQIISEVGRHKHLVSFFLMTALGMNILTTSIQKIKHGNGFTSCAE